MIPGKLMNKHIIQEKSNITLPSTLLNELFAEHPHTQQQIHLKKGKIVTCCRRDCQKKKKLENKDVNNTERIRILGINVPLSSTGRCKNFPSCIICKASSIGVSREAHSGLHVITYPQKLVPQKTY